MEQTKQSEIIKATLENIKSMVDANTVTGTPIETQGSTLIIPVSKIFIGLATGGVDYFGKKSSEIKNFGGGGGTGVTVSPVGFLIVDKSGRVELLSLNPEPKDAISQLIEFAESSPELISKFKKLFDKKEDTEE